MKLWNAVQCGLAQRWCRRASGLLDRSDPGAGQERGRSGAGWGGDGTRTEGVKSVTGGHWKHP